MSRRKKDKNTNEENIDHSTVVIRHYLQIDEEIKNKIKDFLREQREIFKSNPSAHKDLASLILDAALVLKDFENDMKFRENSFVHVAFSPFDKNIIGFSLVLIADDDEVTSSFFGVLPEHWRKGIASKLLTETHKTLKQRGYTSYPVSVWEGSEKVLEKLVGKPLQVDPNNPSSGKIVPLE